MVVVKDNLGEQASPDVFTLTQAVQNMMIDMPQHTREHIELATKQAMENPEDFVRYVIILLGDYRQQMDSIVGALVKEGTITVLEEDNAPSA